jgi:hypothetical protein
MPALPVSRCAGGKTFDPIGIAPPTAADCDNGQGLAGVDGPPVHRRRAGLAVPELSRPRGRCGRLARYTGGLHRHSERHKPGTQPAHRAGRNLSLTGAIDFGKSAQ